MKGMGRVLEHASNDLKKDKKIVLRAVQNDGLALQFADEKLKKDEEVVKAAVKDDGYSLEFADPSLKKNKEIVLASLPTTSSGLSSSFEFADMSLKNDKKFILKVIAAGGAPLQYVDKKLTKDVDIVTSSIKKNGTELEHADDNFKKDISHVIAALIRRFYEKQSPLEVWGDGRDLKDFVYIEDFIDGLLMAFKNEGIERPLNLASGKSETIRKVIQHLKNISNQKNLKVNFRDDMPSMIPYRLISIDKAQKLLNYKPKVSLYQGLRKTYNWYKKFYKIKKNYPLNTYFLQKRHLESNDA